MNFKKKNCLLLVAVYLSVMTLFTSSLVAQEAPQLELEIQLGQSYSRTSSLADKVIGFSEGVALSYHFRSKYRVNAFAQLTYSKWGGRVEEKFDPPLYDWFPSGRDIMQINIDLRAHSVFGLLGTRISLSDWSFIELAMGVGKQVRFLREEEWITASGTKLYHDQPNSSFYKEHIWTILNDVSLGVEVPLRTNLTLCSSAGYQLKLNESGVIYFRDFPRRFYLSLGLGLSLGGKKCDGPVGSADFPKIRNRGGLDKEKEEVLDSKKYSVEIKGLSHHF